MGRNSLLEGNLYFHQLTENSLSFSSKIVSKNKVILMYSQFHSFQKLFQKFDTDRSGCIETYELVTAFRALGKNDRKISAKYVAINQCQEQLHQLKFLLTHCEFKELLIPVKFHTNRPQTNYLYENLLGHLSFLKCGNNLNFISL